jgi:hypothetical protein
VKLVRSWPASIPEGRSYVVDDIPKFVMNGFDYRGLVDLDDDVVLIEWDIAVGGEQLRTFIDRAKAEPDRVRVAPYLLYRGGLKGDRPQVPFYVHRVREPGMRTWVKGPADKYCHLFGFGLIYLPKDLIAGFVAQMGTSKFGDSEFSRWHMRQPLGERRNVPIDWDVHAVHLHYVTPEVH